MSEISKTGEFIEIGDLVQLGNTDLSQPDHPIGIVISIAPSNKKYKDDWREYEVFLVGKNGKALVMTFSCNDLVFLSKGSIR